jgi:leucyl/phenylalanyl-tRNA--protein transferase
MPVFLTSDQALPRPSENSEDLLAIGGSLSPGYVLDGYQKGIFPWYEEGQPLLWWAPDPRMVLFPDKLHISKSMRPYLNQNKFQLTRNKNFEGVIKACAEVPRNGQNGTWITPEMIKTYIELHHRGNAESFEVWDGQNLVGGLYGIYLKEKGVFCGESMFSLKSNASKFGFIKAVQELQGEGVKLIDCQIYNPHLESLGA